MYEQAASSIRTLFHPHDNQQTQGKELDYRVRTYSADFRSDSITYHHSTQGLLHLEPAVAIDRHVLWSTAITTGNQITKTKQCAG
jgi:hypothetical protein